MISTRLQGELENYLLEVNDYVMQTYSKHYSPNNHNATAVQNVDLFHANGEFYSYLYTSISRYASRFGKKIGYNRDDLLKIIHIAMLGLAALDEERDYASLYEEENNRE